MGFLHHFPWFRIDLSAVLLSIASIECLEYPGYDYVRQIFRTYGRPGAAFGSLGSPWLSLALLRNTVATGYHLSRSIGPRGCASANGFQRGMNT